MAGDGRRSARSIAIILVVHLAVIVFWQARGRRPARAEIHPALTARGALHARLCQICLGLEPARDRSRDPRRLRARRAGRRRAGADLHLVAGGRADPAAAVRDAEHDPESGDGPARSSSGSPTASSPTYLSLSRICFFPILLTTARGLSPRSSPTCSISSNRCAARAGRCSAKSSCRVRCPTCSPA